MTQELILLEDYTAKAGGKIGLLRLNNPDTFNSMSMEMADQFNQKIDLINKDPHYRVLIITGQGKAFASGGDFEMLASLAQKSPLENQMLMERFYNSFLSIMHLTIPTIGAINGHAIGAAACLGLATDIRLIAQEAKIGFNFTRIGIHPGMGASYLMNERLGQQNSAYLVFTGKIIDAPTAVKMGYAKDIYPFEELLRQAFQLAEEIAETAPVANALFKRTMSQNGIHSLSDALRHEAKAQAITYSTEDFSNAIQAIRQKQGTIHFQGR